jgi:hypothetical protein
MFSIQSAHMAVMLSALSANGNYIPERSLVLISVRG